MAFDAEGVDASITFVSEVKDPPLGSGWRRPESPGCELQAALTEHIQPFTLNFLDAAYKIDRHVTVRRGNLASGQEF